MRVGICSVGTELLAGDVVDTNAAWLAGRVRESGCELSAIVVVGDDHEQLVDTLRWLGARSDAIVVGGGLGPTADDLTRYAVAEVAGVALERRPELVAHLDRVYAQLNRPIPSDARRQADVPATATVHEPKGTAAGFALEIDYHGRSVSLHVLPGVPWEYRELADRAVLPDLVRRSGGRARVVRTLHVAGMGESAIGAMLRPVSDRLATARGRPDDPERDIELGFLANSDEVLVRLTATGHSPRAAQDVVSPVVDEVADRLGAAVTSVDERRLEDEVGRLLTAMGATAVTAETYTAGRVAAALSSAPDSARYLRGGFVAYTPQMLTTLLGVSSELIARAGVASDAVVEAMARQAQRCTGAEYAVATTGVTTSSDAGPDRPVGTVMWGVASPDQTVHVERQLIPAADRDVMQARGAAFALESLRRHLVAKRSAAGRPPRITP